MACKASSRRKQPLGCLAPQGASSYTQLQDEATLTTWWHCEALPQPFLLHPLVPGPAASVSPLANETAAGTAQIHTAQPVVRPCAGSGVGQLGSLTPLCHHRLTCQVTLDKAQLPEGHSCACTQSRSPDLDSFGSSARACRRWDGPETDSDCAHRQTPMAHTDVHGNMPTAHTSTYKDTHTYIHSTHIRAHGYALSAYSAMHADMSPYRNSPLHLGPWVLCIDTRTPAL